MLTIDSNFALCWIEIDVLLSIDYILPKSTAHAMRENAQLTKHSMTDALSKQKTPSSPENAGGYCGPQASCCDYDDKANNANRSVRIIPMYTKQKSCKAVSSVLRLS